MRKLRITGCTDGHMWYAGMVGELVELLGEDRIEYLSREPAGYVNIVKKADAEVVELQDADVAVNGIKIGTLPAWMPVDPLPLGPGGFTFYGSLAVAAQSTKVQRYKDAKPRW